MDVFVNGKVNLGLQIVRRRSDGYHDLQTVFYPVGLKAGRAENPEMFCDVLEVTRSRGGLRGMEIEFRGRVMDCPREKNLVWRAAKLYLEEMADPSFGARVILEKHLPDGAGLGGGSADASLTLRALAAMEGKEDQQARLASLALRLGADCPFFIYNRPMYAEGVGEKLEPVDLDLSGYWFAVVKPKEYISTKEAFANVRPILGAEERGAGPDELPDLRSIIKLPVAEWQGRLDNGFEESVFPRHPELSAIKEDLLSSGALYSSMSGSGSSLFGIYASEEKAEEALSKYRGKTTIEGTYLLKG